MILLHLVLASNVRVKSNWKHSAPLALVRSVNSIQTRVADYSPHTTASHPGFKKLSTPMSSVGSTKACFVTSVGDQIPISNDELTNLFAYVLDIFFKIK